MLILDVNVLLQAHRKDLPFHPVCLQFLHSLLAGTERFGVPEMVFSSVVRIVTATAFSPPSTTSEALDFCSVIMRSPNCARLVPTTSHWQNFDRLCRVVGASGKRVADAYLAAFAIDLQAELVTLDRDFSRFPGLVWRAPGEAVSVVNPT